LAALKIGNLGSCNVPIFLNFPEHYITFFFITSSLLITAPLCIDWQAAASGFIVAVWTTGGHVVKGILWPLLQAIFFFS
jgi:hypothetical protein